MNILLLGAGGNAGMNFTKCLRQWNYTNGGRGFFQVFGADTNKYYLAASNCHVKVALNYSSPEAKMDSIVRACEKHKIDLIHAQPDLEVEFLLKAHEHGLLPGLIFAGENSAYMSHIYSDKFGCQRVWRDAITPFCVETYRTCYERPDLFERMLSKGGGKVWVRARNGAGSRCALPVSNFEQAIYWIDYWVKTKGMHVNDFILAEFLPGWEYAVQMIYDNGTLVQSQARQRIIYFFGSQMVSGQSSTPAVARTIGEGRVYKTAYDAIKSLEKVPHGIYGVDIKENSLGVLVPTEVNFGRFYTTSDFFARIGINGPALYCAMHKREVFEKDLTKDHPIINLLNTTYVEYHQTDAFHWIRGLDREPQLFNQLMERLDPVDPRYS